MVLRPVGPHPLAVYWRRRVLLLVVVILVLVILVRACSGPGGSPTAAARHHGTGTASQSSPASTSADAPACLPSDLSAAVAARPATAAAGSTIRFTATLSNVGATPCLLQITPSQLVWSVHSGDVTVWSCPSQFSVQRPVAAHGSVTVTSIRWHGKVSSPPSCEGNTPAQAGRYTVRLRFGRTRSPATGFTLS